MLNFRILPLLLAGAALLPAQSNSTIQGTVTDAAKNRPVPGASVSAVRTGLPPFTRSVKTNLGGNFSIPSLPAGAYTLCVQAPGTTYLPTCAWTSTPPIVTLADGQTSTGNALRLVPGSLLNVRIQDPAGLATQKLPTGSLPHLAIGVAGARGLIIPASVHIRDKAGATYQVAVPFDTNLRLSVFSAHLSLADSSGTALSRNAASQPFTHTSTAPTQPGFTYTVTGRLP